MKQIPVDPVPIHKHDSALVAASVAHKDFSNISEENRQQENSRMFDPFSLISHEESPPGFLGACVEIIREKTVRR